jgi:hypothetical protein
MAIQEDGAETRAVKPPTNSSTPSTSSSPSCGSSLTAAPSAFFRGMESKEYKRPPPAADEGKTCPKYARISLVILYSLKSATDMLFCNKEKNPVTGLTSYETSARKASWPVHRQLTRGSGTLVKLL